TDDAATEPGTTGDRPIRGAGNIDEFHVEQSAVLDKAGVIGGGQHVSLDHAVPQPIVIVQGGNIAVICAAILPEGTSGTGSPVNPVKYSGNQLIPSPLLNINTLGGDAAA